MIFVSFFNTSHNVICFFSKYKKCKDLEKKRSFVLNLYTYNWYLLILGLHKR